MKIKEITEEKIIFDNGNEITFDHEQNCCEYNYADFEQIKDDPYINMEFEPELDFEFIENIGFTFGNGWKKIFVPCYSDQNGYYTDEIDIYYNGEIVVSGQCKEVIE